MQELTANAHEPMQSQEIGELIAALSKAQGSMEGANKSADNPFFKSKYADLHECIQAAREPLAKNNLAVVQTTEPSDTGIVIVTTLAHSSGQWIRGKIKMNPKKDDDQGRGSSITYGRRYAFAAIVGLAQKDDDGNASCASDKKQKAPAEPTVDEKFSKAIDWISDFAKKAITVDQFDLEIDKQNARLNQFTGRHKKDINATISDVRQHLEEQNANN